MLYTLRVLDNYRHLSEAQSARLPDAVKIAIRSRIEKYGQAILAVERICKLQQRLHHANLRLFRCLIWLFLGLLGAFLYASTASLVTMLLDRELRLLAVPILGAVFALIGEDRTKRTITSLRLWSKRRSIEHQLQQQRRKAHNSFDRYFYDCQLILLRKVEHHSPALLDGALALVMILVEASAAYYLVLQAQGSVFAFFAASVPAIVIFLTAAAASEYLDMPEEFGKILQEYEAYMHIPEYLMDEDMPLPLPIESGELTIANPNSVPEINIERTVNHDQN